jgi:hypothetical protein
MALALSGKPAAQSLSTQFNDFLYAPLGEDENGRRVSVLSALARLDIDPWERAAHLHALPGDAAVHELAALVAGLPERYSARAAPERIATALIALMPRRGGPVIAPRLPRDAAAFFPSIPRMPAAPTTPMARGAPPASPLARWQIIIGYAVLFLLSQWLFASVMPRPVPAAPAQAPALTPARTPAGPAPSATPSPAVPPGGESSKRDPIPPAPEPTVRVPNP